MKNSKIDLKNSLLLLACLGFLPKIHGMEGVGTISGRNAECATINDVTRCSTCTSDLFSQGKCVDCTLFSITPPYTHGTDAYHQGIKGCATCMVLAPKHNEITSAHMIYHVNRYHGANMFSCKPCNMTFKSNDEAVAHFASTCPQLRNPGYTNMACNFCKTETPTVNIFSHECKHFQSNEYLENQF